MSSGSPSQLSIRSADLRLLRALYAYGVRCLVVGGVAVQFFGCREWNEVDDLDLLMDSSRENVRRFLDALASEKIRVRYSEDELARSEVQIRIKEAPYYTEILTPRSDLDFRALFERGIETTVNGVTVRIAARADLVDMKREMVEKLAKHTRDLACLEAV